MRKLLVLLIFPIFIGGCAEIAMDNNLYEYKRVQHTISLGDSKNRVLGTLLPMMQDLPSNWKRPADQYLVNDDRYYVHYHRTGWTSDGLLTDDELTPYVFKNDVLVSIGWQALGGVKTTGNAAAASANQRAQSQALIDLGQEMLKTPTPSTTTSTCRVTGTGAFKTVTCY
tara:strand:+ start:799 stop:1308 length:510 start_codon:yes stop_codon:yes gene_type:complete